MNLAVAWYRFRATFARQWSGYFAIALLIGLVWGVAMGAITAARSTQASYSELLTRVNASDLAGAVSFYNPTVGSNSGYYPTLLQTIAHLPHVEHVESEVGLDLLPLGPDGLPIPTANWYADGSVDGLNFDQDRLIIAHGRLPDPNDPGAFVMDSVTAKLWNMRLGEVVTFGVFDNAQAAGSPTGIRPQSQLRATLVGIGTTSATSLFQDGADSGTSSTVLFTPALTRRLLGCCADNTLVGLRLDGGFRYSTAVIAEIAAVVPKGVPFSAPLASAAAAKANRALRPESIALGVFGSIAGLATIVIGGQAVGRRFRSIRGDAAILRALGAAPSTVAADGGLGVFGAIAIGTLLAIATDAALSVLAPLGPVRPYLPKGVHLDATVLAIGSVVLIFAMSGITLAFAYQESPVRSSERPRRRGAGGSAVARAAGDIGLPLPAVTGMRFALDPGTGYSAAPVRAAMLGAVLALTVMTATVTFGASLRNLVSHPPLYGWNWDYAVSAGGGDIPAQFESLLARDRLVSRWSGVYFGTLDLNGQAVAVMGTDPGADVGPAVLSGHQVLQPDQVVLGPLTLSRLHLKVGDTVEVGTSGSPPTPLDVVGTATLPAIGGSPQHLEMGSGAVLDYQLIPAGQRNLFDQPQPGPQAIMLDVEPGTTEGSVDRSIDSIINQLGGGASGGQPVLGPQRPAEIIAYRNLGATPAVLGGALASGAAVALELALVASVRRRRRDLAVLKALGFTRRQLISTIAWQSSIAVAVGATVGIPLGISSESPPMEPLRQRNKRGSGSGCAGGDDRPHRVGVASTGQPGGRYSRLHSRPNPDRAGLTRRLTRLPRSPGPLSGALRSVPSAGGSQGLS